MLTFITTGGGALLLFLSCLTPIMGGRVGSGRAEGGDGGFSTGLGGAAWRADTFVGVGLRFYLCGSLIDPPPQVGFCPRSTPPGRFLSTVLSFSGRERGVHVSAAVEMQYAGAPPGGAVVENEHVPTCSADWPLCSVISLVSDAGAMAASFVFLTEPKGTRRSPALA